MLRPSSGVRRLHSSDSNVSTRGVSPNDGGASGDDDGSSSFDESPGFEGCSGSADAGADGGPAWVRSKPSTGATGANSTDSATIMEQPARILRGMIALGAALGNDRRSEYRRRRRKARYLHPAAPA